MSGEMGALGKILPRLILLAVGTGAAAEFARLSLPWQYRPLFESIGKARGVDPDLLHALALNENFGQNPAAIGATNADGTRDYGLMQINQTNFAALGLGTVDAALWSDAAHSIDAAAQLIARNMASAPSSGLLDQLSIYNAGISAHGPRPKLTDAGLYINGRYVWSGLLWYIAIALATLAPFGVKLIGSAPVTPST